MEEEVEELKTFKQIFPLGSLIYNTTYYFLLFNFKLLKLETGIK